MSEAPTTEEAPERMFANEGWYVQDGVVTLVRIPKDQFSSNPVKAFGPFWVRYDIAAAQVEALTKERDEARKEAHDVGEQAVYYMRLAARQAILLREAGEALRPFASDAAEMPDGISDGQAYCHELGPEHIFADFTVGDARRARAVLAKLEALGR